MEYKLRFWSRRICTFNSGGNSGFKKNAPLLKVGRYRSTGAPVNLAL